MKIVILDGYTANPGDLSWSAVEELGELKIFPRTQPDDIVSRAMSADIVLTNKCQMTKEIIDKLPNLKCICLLATGYNNIDVSSATERNIVVCNAAGYSTTSVAQHIFSMILTLTNGVYVHGNSVKSGEWASCDDFSYSLQSIEELQGKVLGIYGFGKIGEAVAKVANAFGMTTIATRKNRDKHKSTSVKLVSEKELLSQSDFLSLNAPLTNDTEHFINRSTLAQMKPSAILINTARGQLIHEGDLAYALNKKIIKAAALDVLSQEPPDPNNALIGLSNCIVTPHIAWASKASRGRLIQIVADNIKSYIEGSPMNVVN